MASLALGLPHLPHSDHPIGLLKSEFEERAREAALKGNSEKQVRQTFSLQISGTYHFLVGASDPEFSKEVAGQGQPVLEPPPAAGTKHGRDLLAETTHRYPLRILHLVSVHGGE